MEEKFAVGKTDDLIKLILQYQPNLFGTAAANTPENAKQVAQSIAALRAELIAQLTPQP